MKRAAAEDFDLAEQLFSSGVQPDLDQAPVSELPMPADQAAPLEAIDEPGHGRRREADGLTELARGLGFVAELPKH
jgi:hypothetical protein